MYDDCEGAESGVWMDGDYWTLGNKKRSRVSRNQGWSWFCGLKVNPTSHDKLDCVL